MWSRRSRRRVVGQPRAEEEAEGARRAGVVRRGLLIVATWFVQYLEHRRELVLSILLPRAALVLPVLLAVIYFLISRIQIPSEAFIYVQF